MAELTITSPAFKHEKPIPAKYSCQGEDINPPLNINGIPEEAKTLVLIMDDPDAPMGTFDHWVMWNIPPVSEISEDTVPEGAEQGKNSWDKNEYGGPCPPSGTHRYYFKLYALDTSLDLPASSGKKDVESAMSGHVLAETVLMGTYEKS
jgi:Raf kinase inhibitor-like YbhB/YbcL family protein